MGVEGQYKETGHEGNHTDQCVMCTAGQHGNSTHHGLVTSALHCKDCPSGKYSLGNGWASCDQCETCESGEYRSLCGFDSAGNCSACDIGAYKSGPGTWDSACTECHGLVELFGFVFVHPRLTPLTRHPALGATCIEMVR